jgi:exodeoxyribonuclease V beta subunit
VIESAPTPFDLLQPLPEGRLALQASAGTGKTYTLAALATRFVAEQGVAASELLVVTFTRAATAELRARLRERLVAATSALRGTSTEALSGDPLLAFLASHDRERRLARTERALAELDAATITTIHGFAAQVLGLVGSAAGTDPDASLVDDAQTLVAEVCADVLAGAATEPGGAVLPQFEELRRAVEVALRIPDLRLLPEPGQEAAGPADLRRAELVGRALRAVAVRRRQAGTLSFDDLLVELRRALAGPRRAAVVEAVRSRFKVVLVDEFQDTDPVQWDILEGLFAGQRPGTALVLVGDPKQAIYSFRGADVHTYLEAVSGADRRSLEVNWRSDPAALGALDALLGGVTFGDDTIDFVPSEAAEVNRDGRLRADSGEALPALSLRLALGPDLARSKRKPHDISTADAERAIAADLVAQVRALLERARLPRRAAGAAGHGDRRGEVRAVRPSDVAVLVRSSREAAWVQAALVAGGIPAVMARGGNVLASPAVEHWRWLLEALLRPSEPARARLFALSWFGGRTPDWVAGASDEELGALQDRLASWAETLAASGVVDLVRRVWSETGVAARVLARPDGDRDVTDLGHIGELLQGGTSGPASVAGLLALLDAEMPVDADAEAEADVAARRIESEDDAVQIMTVWVSKGLEFPVVCCPTLWRKPQEPPTIFQDCELGGRVYDVTGGAGWPDPAAAGARKQRAAAEALGENLRLLYVGLTRAQHQTIVWWTRAPGSDTTALARVLFARKGADLDPTEFHEARVSLPDDDAALEALAPLVARAGGAIAAAPVGTALRCPPLWIDPQASPAPAALQLAGLEHLPDRSAHRWSFTAMTAAEAAHADPYDDSLADAGAADERGADEADPDRRGDDRADRGGGVEPGLPLGGPAEGVDGGEPPGPALRRAVAAAGGGLALLPAGASFGTLVHAVLEATDFTADHLEEQLAVAIDRQLAWRSVDLAPVGVEASPEDGRQLLIEGLRAALDSPLGPLLGGRCLRDVAPDDRLDELTFELLLGGPPPPTDRDIGRLVLRHLGPGDPLSAWASSVADGAFGVDLAGHLTGSIDAVVRLRDDAERYVVVDYKTNRLHRPGTLATPGDYHPDRLVEAMAGHHYPLQALLYLVALHRYLRWRLRGYDPAVNLGGAAYLFVRGMTGSEVPVSDGSPHGVFAWAVPPALVAELSDLLDGRPAVAR